MDEVRRDLDADLMAVLQEVGRTGKDSVRELTRDGAVRRRALRREIAGRL